MTSDPSPWMGNSNSPWRGQMARANRKVRYCQRMLTPDVMANLSAFSASMLQKIVALQRRQEWHQAWVDYGREILRTRRVTAAVTQTEEERKNG